MPIAPLVAFGLVFLATSLTLSVVAMVSLRLSAQRLRRAGPWVGRRAAAAALSLPPLLALLVTCVLAVDSAAALAAGTDHCLAHDHHLHLCWEHGAAWAARPWALALVVGAVTFVMVRLGSSLASQASAQRAVSRLRSAATPLGEPGCYLAPSDERFAFTAGLLVPTVIVSSGAWAQLGAAERRAVLAHERAHVAHGDLWRRAALGFAASLGAPALTSAALQLWDLFAERLCDRQAALVVGRPSTVASAILALAPSAESRPVRLGAVFAAACHVTERIESVLGEQSSGLRSSRRFLGALAVGALVVAVGCAVFSEPLHHVIETILG